MIRMGANRSDTKRSIEDMMRNHRGTRRTAWKNLLLVTAGVMTIGAPVSVVNTPRLHAQSQPISANGRAFEVASVKPNKTVGAQRDGRLQPGHFSQTAVTLRQLIRMAYGVSQMAGAPNWIDTDLFDVEGKGTFAMADYLPGADGSQAPVYAMLRSLLMERFKLAAHTESRDTAIYALVTANKDGRLGPQLKHSDVDCDAMLAAIAITGKLPVVEPGKAPPCSASPRPGRITGKDLSMERLAGALSGPVNRIVRDRTGLKGNFDLALEWTADDLSPNGASGVSIFTALQEQLGLKLESVTGAVDVLVIDHVEQPTPN
jgi:bla regulator protein blaR1